MGQARHCSGGSHPFPISRLPIPGPCYLSKEQVVGRVARASPRGTLTLSSCQPDSGGPSGIERHHVARPHLIDCACGLRQLAGRGRGRWRPPPARESRSRAAVGRAEEVRTVGTAPIWTSSAFGPRRRSNGSRGGRRPPVVRDLFRRAARALHTRDRRDAGALRGDVLSGRSAQVRLARAEGQRPAGGGHHAARDTSFLRDREQGSGIRDRGIGEEGAQGSPLLNASDGAES